jgi:hypothetical protein
MSERVGEVSEGRACEYGDESREETVGRINDKKERAFVEDVDAIAKTAGEAWIIQMGCLGFLM